MRVRMWSRSRARSQMRSTDGAEQMRIHMCRLGASEAQRAGGAHCRLVRGQAVVDACVEIMKADGTFKQRM